MVLFEVIIKYIFKSYGNSQVFLHCCLAAVSILHSLCFDTVQSCRWIQQSQFFNFSHCCCCSFRSCWLFCCCNWDIVTELNAWPWQWRHFNASEYQLAAGTAWLTNMIHFEYLIVSQIGYMWNIWNDMEYTLFMRSKRLKLRVFPLKNNPEKSFFSEIQQFSLKWNFNDIPIY